MKTRMKNSRRAKKRGRKRVAEATNTPDTFQDTATVPRMSLSREGDRQIIILNHQNGTTRYELHMEEFGTTDPVFLNGIMLQITNACLRGNEIDLAALDFMLSVIKGIKPKDQVEAMLVAQMAAVHSAVMKYVQYLANSENIIQQDSGERVLNKLIRTFASQMEALKRYRTGGEQKVTVQHVSVAEGGQAIVGNVTQAPRDDATRNSEAAPPALTDAKAEPMPIIDKSNERISVPTGRKPRQK